MLPRELPLILLPYSPKNNREEQKPAVKHSDCEVLTSKLMMKHATNFTAYFIGVSLLAPQPLVFSVRQSRSFYIIILNGSNIELLPSKKLNCLNERQRRTAM